MKYRGATAHAEQAISAIHRVLRPRQRGTRGMRVLSPQSAKLGTADLTPGRTILPPPISGVAPAHGALALSPSRRAEGEEEMEWPTLCENCLTLLGEDEWNNGQISAHCEIDHSPRRVLWLRETEEKYRWQVYRTGQWLAGGGTVQAAIEAAKALFPSLELDDTSLYATVKREELCRL